MFSLRLLGSLSLEGPSDPVSGPAAQPGRLALLALLAVPDASPVSRDKVVALLWPEHSKAQGRRRLSDSLYVLRQTLGDDAIRAVGDELRLDTDCVRTDVAEFHRALEQGQPEEAVEVYGGPFLDGVHLRDSVEFERWVDRQRQNLSADYRQALETLARTAEDTRDPTAAVRWRRKIVAQSPYSTSAVVALMRALEKAGDPAAAVRAGRLHEKRLEEELGAEPDPTLVEVLERIRTSPRPGEPPPTAPSSAVDSPTDDAEGGGRLGGWKRTAVAAALVIAVVGGAWALFFEGSGSGTGRTDADRVAVFPFRVSGAAASLNYLGEGMMDLLSAKLTGEVGPRAIDPRTALSAWRQEVTEGGEVDGPRLRALASRLGAGRVLLGEVVGSPDRLTISASLERVRRPDRGITTQFTGPADSLTALVDRLVGRLLVGITGAPDQAAGSRLTTSLPALKSYLAGRQAYRSGHRDRAIRRFNEALDRDSSFALAAIGLAEVSFNLPGGSTGRHPFARRALRLARAADQGLSPTDRRYVEALSRPRYPDWMFPWDEVIAKWESALDQFLAKPEAWYQLGLHLAAFGPQIGRAEAHELAASALGRALQLDSTYLPALERLIWLETRQGDRRSLGPLLARYRALGAAGEASGYTRWRVARALDDEESLAELRSRFDELSNESLIRMVGLGQVDGIGLRDVRRAASALAERVREREGWEGAYSRETVIYLLKNYAVNRGRPGEADSLLRVRWEGRLDWPRYHHDRIYAALYEGGDTTGAAESARRLAGGRETTMPYGWDLADPADEADVHHLDLCLSWQWQLWQGDTVGAESAIRRVRAAEKHRGTPCATVLELLLAAERGDEAARSARSVADEYVAAAWKWPMGFMLNFAAARLHETLGEYAAAAATLRHRPRRPLSGTWTLGHSLHEIGRLSLLARDTSQALSAYRHWLALHDEPEESRREEVARVRSLVESLQVERESR